MPTQYLASECKCGLARVQGDLAVRQEATEVTLTDVLILKQVVAVHTMDHSATHHAGGCQTLVTFIVILRLYVQHLPWQYYIIRSVCTPLGGWFE